MIIFGEDNACKYNGVPFLLETCDSPDNMFSVVIALPVTSVKGSGIEETGNNSINKLLKKSVPVLPDEKNIYEITFDGYILYQTRNESFCSIDKYEKYLGTHFIIYTKSRLLDYLGKATDCQILSDGTYYPGEWKHYGIITNSHIIDIISAGQPVIIKRK